MDNVVLAKIGDIELTKDDMIKIMRNLPQQQQQQVAGIEGRQRLLEEMIAGELFYLQAKELGYDTEEKFQSLLAEATRTILQQYSIQKILETVKVEEGDLRAYYEANQDFYKAGETAKASHILMAEEPDILKVKEEIDHGKSFAEAAAEYSTCPSKDRGGDLGSFEKGRMVPEFETVAFTQEVGVVSDPVKTQFGYHLILVNERSDASVKSFEEVAQEIGQELTMQKQTEVYRAHIEALKGKYTVEVFEDALA